MDHPNNDHQMQRIDCQGNINIRADEINDCPEKAIYCEQDIAEGESTLDLTFTKNKKFLMGI